MTRFRTVRFPFNRNGPLLKSEGIVVTQGNIQESSSRIDDRARLSLTAAEITLVVQWFDDGEEYGDYLPDWRNRVETALQRSEPDENFVFDWAVTSR